MSDRQRVIIVSGSYPKLPCGVSGHIKLIAPLTAQRPGFDVHVLTTDDPAIDHSLPQDYTLHADVKRWGYRDIATVGRQILALQPDVVHLQNPSMMYRGRQSLFMSLLAPWLKRQQQAPRVVVMQHDIAVSKPWLRWRYWPLLHTADAIMVSNQRDYQAVRDLGIRTDKIHHAPVGPHFRKIPAQTPERRAEARLRWPIPPESKCLVYMGYIHPQRNIHIVLEALAQLNREGNDTHAIIMGAAQVGTESYYQHCQSLAGKLGIAKSVIWTGYATEEQIADGLAAGDAFISLPQRGADMRNTSVMTGIRAELPVITTENRAYYSDPDLAALGVKLVEPQNITQIVRALTSAFDEPPSTNRALCRAYLDPDRIWQEHIDVTIRAYNGLAPQPALSLAEFKKMYDDGS